MGFLSRIASAFSRDQRALSAAAPAPQSFAAPKVGAPLTKRLPVYSPALRSTFWPWGSPNTIDAVLERMYGPHARAREPDTVIKLMLGDPDIAFGRYVWRSRFQSVEWTVKGGTPEQSAFVEKTLIAHIHQWIESSLWTLDFGRQAVELVWGLEDVTIDWSEGPPGKATPRRRVMKRAYVLRPPRALDPEQTAVLVDGRGDYAGVRYAGASEALPPERAVLFVNEDLWGDLLGVQFTARAKPAWEQSNFTRLWLNRYLQGKGDPPFVGTAPGLEETDEEGNITNPIRTMAAAAANIRGGGSIILPFEVDPESKLPIYTLKALEIAQRAEEFLPWLKELRAEKRLAWCIPGDVGGGAGEGGAFAKSKVSFDMLDPFFDVVKKRVILDTLNRHVVPKLIEANYGETARADMPYIEGGDLSHNAKAVFAELIKNGYAGTTILADGRRVRTSHLADVPKILKTLNAPMVDPALIPDAPDEIDLVAGGGLRPGPGQPRRIAGEDNRPDAPSRPGLARAFALPTPDAWLSATNSGLDRIDQVVFKAGRLIEAERQSVEAEIRNLAKKAIARARTKDGAIAAKNRTLASDLERDVRALLEKSLHEDLLDASEIDAGALGFAKKRSPLADAHGQAFQAASATLTAAGVSAPGKAAGLRIVRDVVRDAAANGQGVVVRETRRIVEDVDRLVIGEASVETADAVVDTYELPDRDLVSSTQDHVRATARATLTWSGAQAEADAWLVAAGPSSEATVLDHWPTGQVAEELWTVKTTDELDARYHDLMVEQGRPVTSWRNLGPNFGSPEMYVPIPRELEVGVRAVAGERRAAWNEKRAARQEKVAEQIAKKAGAAPIGGGAGLPPVKPPTTATGGADDAPPPKFKPQQAFVQEAKALWLLDPKNKGPMFKNELGFDKSNVAELFSKIVAGVAKYGALFSERTDHGHKYLSDSPVISPTGQKAIVRTVWQIDNGSDKPRFVTAFTL